MTRLRPAQLMLFVLTLALLASCAKESEHPPRANTEIEFVTSSGMHVRMLPHPGSGLFASNVFVGAGSTRETDETAGSSHFLEHLIFNGTESRTQEELYADTDRIGAYSNATTRREYTHYMMVAPREEFAAGLEIQADMLLRSTLPDDKFEKERGIVLEEMTKDADNPQQRRQRIITEALFGESDFARPVLGTVETISSLDRQKVLDYYHAQYTPSNMKLVLMGDFDVEDARMRIEAAFTAADGVARPAPRLALSSESTLYRRGSEEEELTLVVQIGAPQLEHGDFAAMTLLTDVLGGGESSRLRRAMDLEPKLEVLDIGASMTHLEGSGVLEIHGRFAPSTDPDAALARILGEMATLGRAGILASEWATARTRALGDAVRQVEQLHYYALMQGDRIWHSPNGFEQSFQVALEGSYPQIAPASQSWFGAPTVSAVILGPGIEDADETVAISAMGYVPREDAEPGAELPGGGLVEEGAERVYEEQGPTITTLDNGLTLIHAASPSTRMFATHLMVLDRSAREPADQAGIADLLHRCLPEGAGNYDREEFAALLDGIGAEWKVTDSAFIPYDDYYGIDPRFSFVRMDCVDIYWRESLRLLGLMLSDARLEDEAIDRAREQMLQRVRQDAPRASKQSSAAIEKMIRGEGDPRTRPVFGNEESLAAIDGKALQGFALEYLDPSQLVLAVVGNIDRDAVVSHLNAVLARSGANTARAALATAAVTSESKRVDLEVGGRQSYLRMARVVEVEAEDQWALEVAAMIASNRMQQDLRETKGWAYSLGVFTSTESMPVAAGEPALVRIGASMGTQAMHLEAAEPAMREYLTQGTFETDPDEIATVVNRALGRARMRRVTSLGRAFNLSYDHVFHGDLAFNDRRSAGLRSVDPEDVARAAERYLGDGPLLVAVAK